MALRQPETGRGLTSFRHDFGLHPSLLQEEPRSSAKRMIDAGISPQIPVFITFSSTSAVIGLSRNADYSTSNAMLDSFMPFRSSNGLCQTNTCWGAVQGLGLADFNKKADDVLKGYREARSEKERFAELMRIYLKVLRGGPDPQSALPEREALLTLSQAVAKPSAFKKKEEEWVEPESSEDKPPDTGKLGPAKGDFVTFQAEAAEDVGILVRTRSAEDRVLLVGHSEAPSQAADCDVAWTLRRGDASLGPSFHHVTHAGRPLERAQVAWLDLPSAPDLQVEYSLRRPQEFGAGNNISKLTALVFPGEQITSSRSDTVMTVEAVAPGANPGDWYQIPGMQQLTATTGKERVLVVCTLTYSALWSDARQRGVFRLMRDGLCLDYGAGWQSVRASESGVKRSIVMAMVDDPEPGLHVYMGQSAVLSANGRSPELRLEPETRQMALIRLPGSSVVGPRNGNELGVQDPLWVDMLDWREVPGMSVTVTTKSSDERVLIVWHTTITVPTGQYEAHFTLFRTSLPGSRENLGHKDIGLCTVESESRACSDYPTSLLVDSPAAGTHIYTAYARTASGKQSFVSAGPDGQISAVRLPAEAAS
mmetsp:Transcript_60585/g.131318  ORF Transcript_60585/g.131318 Transcript_60585/m.131318 type:complete len:593 (+) Transcript_60585:56-1834(+)